MLSSSAPAQDSDLAVGSRPDPVVEAIVAAPRETPADFIRAVFVLSDIGEAARAQPILEALVGQRLDDAALAALVTEFGSAKFLRLANNPAMGPAAQQFAGRCMAAAAAQIRSPERLAALVDRLAAGNERERVAALVDLRTTGTAGAEQVLAALAAAAGDKPRQNRLRKALVALAPESTPLLLAALESGDATLMPQAAVALAEVGDPQAVGLLAVAATLDQGSPELAETAVWAVGQITGQPFDFRRFELITSRAIEQYLSSAPADTPGGDGRVTVSRWDAEAKRATSVRLPATEAGVVLAAPLAAAQAAVLGDRPRLVRRGLVLTLEARAIVDRAGLTAGADPNEQPNPAAGVPPSELSRALADAVNDGRSGAAVALCDALAELGDIGVLASGNGRPAPLAATLDAPHPAVRFAAVRAIVELNPPAPFPGSSRVVPTLEAFANAEGSVIVVVAMPNYDRAATLGGRLSTFGLRPRVTNRGEEAVKLASIGGDVSAVFVDMAVIRPPVRETLFQLRRQVGSAGVPIALTAGAGRLADAERIAQEHTGVLATPRPHTDAAAATIVNQLAALRPGDWPDPETRVAQAQQARRWIAELRNGGPSFYNLPRFRDAGQPAPALAEPLPAAP